MKAFYHSYLVILEGCLLVALGTCFLKSNQLLISGTAGIAMLLTYTHDYSFGVYFTAINIPFFLIAFKFLGKMMAIKSLCAILVVSVFSDFLNHSISIDMHPVFTAPAAGLLIGIGLSLIFSVNASLGGINILALALEKRYNIHSAKTLAVNDACLAVVALLVMPIQSVLYSILSFAALSIVLGRYHRKIKIGEPTPSKKTNNTYETA